MLDDTSSCPITCTYFALRTVTPHHCQVLSERGSGGAAGEFRKCRGQRPRLQARFGSANFSVISRVPRKATTKNGITCATIQFGPAWHEALPIGHSREKLTTSGCSRGRCPRLTVTNSDRKSTRLNSSHTV